MYRRSLRAELPQYNILAFLQALPLCMLHVPTLSLLQPAITPPCNLQPCSPGGGALDRTSLGVLLYCACFVTPRGQRLNHRTTERHVDDPKLNVKTLCQPGWLVVAPRPLQRATDHDDCRYVRPKGLQGPLYGRRIHPRSERSMHPCSVLPAVFSLGTFCSHICNLATSSLLSGRRHWPKGAIDADALALGERSTIGSISGVPMCQKLKPRPSCA